MSDRTYSTFNSALQALVVSRRPVEAQYMTIGGMTQRKTWRELSMEVLTEVREPKTYDDRLDASAANPPSSSTMSQGAGWSVVK